MSGSRREIKKLVSQQNRVAYSTISLRVSGVSKMMLQNPQMDSRGCRRDMGANIFTQLYMEAFLVPVGF